MVRLNCASLAERALVPAFVYFFQMLYPFAKVNDPRSAVAAAAGGTVLIRREALERIGGIDAIKDALIDDVALAKAVKPLGGRSISATPVSPHPCARYRSFADIWHMISRTAFTQLRHSAALLVPHAARVGPRLVGAARGALFCHGWRFASPASAPVLLAAGSYLPTLTRYGRSHLWAAALPLIALFYMAATVGSALNYWRGRGARWKSRAYQP